MCDDDARTVKAQSGSRVRLSAGENNVSQCINEVIQVLIEQQDHPNNAARSSSDGTKILFGHARNMKHEREKRDCLRWNR